jgi:hypothetical protein
MKPKVGGYYELEVNKGRKVAFAILYGFESGKNKDTYALMMYTGKRNFEFPVRKSLLNKWDKEGRIKEITSDEILKYALT